MLSINELQNITNLVKAHLDKCLVKRPAIVARDLEVALELLLLRGNDRLGQVYELENVLDKNSPFEKQPGC